MPHEIHTKPVRIVTNGGNNHSRFEWDPVWLYEVLLLRVMLTEIRSTVGDNTLSENSSSHNLRVAFAKADDNVARCSEIPASYNAVKTRAGVEHCRESSEKDQETCIVHYNWNPLSKGSPTTAWKCQRLIVVFNAPTLPRSGIHRSERMTSSHENASCSTSRNESAGLENDSESHLWRYRNHSGGPIWLTSMREHRFANCKLGNLGKPTDNEEG